MHPTSQQTSCDFLPFASRHAACIAFPPPPAPLRCTCQSIDQSINRTFVANNYENIQLTKKLTCGTETVQRYILFRYVFTAKTANIRWKTVTPQVYDDDDDDADDDGRGGGILKPA